MEKKDLTELTSEEKEKPVTWGELVEVAKMIGEEVNKVADRIIDLDKNATDEIMQMIIGGMNTRFVFLLQLMCNTHGWDYSKMLQAYDHFKRQMENTEEP